MNRTKMFREGTEKPLGVPYTETPASEKQMSFIRSLLSERVLTPKHEQYRDDTGLVLNKNQASEWIGQLLELDKKEFDRTGEPNLPDVPAGRYAITGEDGTTDFYKVDRPDQGKWKGYVFAKLLVASGGFGDDLSEQRLSFPQTKSVLVRIEADGVEDAMKRYGRKLGVCGHCGRTLTDNESIELGIGPVCAGRMGF